MGTMSHFEGTISADSKAFRCKQGLPSNPKAFLFDNAIPVDPKTFRRSFVRPQGIEKLADQEDHITAQQYNDRLRSIFWPTIALCVPVTILSAALLTLIFINRVVPHSSVFDDDQHRMSHWSFILVNFSATRLVFISGFISTMAPLLSSFIMSLYAFLASNKLREATRDANYGGLPTPFQMSLLVGVLLASMKQLREYFWYLFSRKRRANISPVVHRSATVFTLAVLLTSGIIIADAILHYFTNTVEFSQIALSTASSSFGRGLSSTCLNFDRTVYGWPCSVGLGWNDPNLFEEQNEYIRLAHNTSTTSSIHIANPSTLNTSLAYLLPSATGHNNSIDYSASTVGISTSCTLLPPTTCNMTTSGPSNIYTNFTCNPNFFSTLGLTPSPSEADGIRTPDPSRSFLMYKPASNLMYSFFTTPSLNQIYNSVGYNDSGQLDPSLLPYPDKSLLNPFYLGLAARLPTSSLPPSSPVLSSSSLLFSASGNAYIDFILSCSVTSHAVTYTSLQGTSHQISSTPHQNGSIVEIFHGSQLYTSIGNSGYDLQDYLVQAALASTSTSRSSLNAAPSPSSSDPTSSFTTKFASLYSIKVLSKIGAYSTPRPNTLQQSHRTLLLAKVPTLALGAVICLSLLYPIIGIVLLIKVWHVSGGGGGGSSSSAKGSLNVNVQEIAQQLSLAGLSGAAFGDSLHQRSSPGVARMRSDLTGLSRSAREKKKEKKGWERKETRRVIVDGDAENEFHFRVMGYGAP